MFRRCQKNNKFILSTRQLFNYVSRSTHRHADAQTQLHIRTHSHHTTPHHSLTHSLTHTTAQLNTAHEPIYIYALTHTTPHHTTPHNSLTHPLTHTTDPYTHTHSLTPHHTTHIPTHLLTPLHNSTLHTEDCFFYRGRTFFCHIFDNDVADEESPCVASAPAGNEGRRSTVPACRAFGGAYNW